MKKYCINNQDGYCHLTFGRGYEIEQETDDSYMVKNDKGQIKPYLKDKFVNSQEEVNKIIDRNNNPSDYFSPVELQLNITGRSIELHSIEVDQQLLGVGNIQEFLNIQPLYGVKVASKYKAPNIYSGYIDFGKDRILEQTKVTATLKDNRAALEFANNILKEIDYINSKLIMTKKEKQIVYLVEHEPDGKRYAFKSEEILKMEQLVICDTKKGKQYGVVKGIDYENINQYLNRSNCYEVQGKVI